MSELAIFGGPPVLTAPMKRYNSIGSEEIEAALQKCPLGVANCTSWRSVVS